MKVLGGEGDEEPGGGDAGGVAGEASLVVLGTEVAADGRPGLGPAVVAGEGAEREHRVDVAGCPVHPAAFQAGLDNELVGALDRAAADRIPGRAEARVVELSGARLQVA